MQASAHELLQAAEALVQWVRAALHESGLADVPVLLDDGDERATPGVRVQLLGLSAEDVHAGSDLLLRAHFALRPVALIGARLAEVVGALAFALLAQRSWQLRLSDGEPTTSAPVLQVSAVVRRTVAPKPVRRVLKSLAERPAEAPPMFGEVARLGGKVVGPNGVPLAGALVEWTTTGMTAVSDERGDFRFAAGPSRHDRPLALRVRARGQQWELEVPVAASRADALQLAVEFDE